MEAKVDLDAVLDLIVEFQEDLLEAIEAQSQASSTYRILWETYRRSSELYNDIRRAA
jgi:hypothetical protein